MATVYPTNQSVSLPVVKELTGDPRVEHPDPKFFNALLSARRRFRDRTEMRYLSSKHPFFQFQCVRWTGYVPKNRAPYITVHGIRYTIWQYAYLLQSWVDLTAFTVLPQCPTRLCVNYRHLTKVPRIELSRRNAKLTLEQEEEVVRMRFVEKRATKDIAAHFGVKIGVIQRILQPHYYTHL